MTSLLYIDPFGPALSPLILLLLACLGGLYARGLLRPRRLRPHSAPWQDALFVVGLLAIAAANSAPLAPRGAEMFSVHQLSHLLTRVLGPLLIAAAQPWGILSAAMPRLWRRRLRHGANARIARGLWHPAAATALFIATLYLWQVPTLYALARDIPALGLAAHVTMTMAGLWFFAMILDPRDPPEGARRGARLLCGVVVIVSNILLGSLTTLKEVVLYGPPGTRGNLSAMADETIGGYTIWVPSSMAMIAAIILVLNGWNRAEERRWNARHAQLRQSNSAALEFPETAEELRLKVAKSNRDIGRTLAFAVVAMFATVMITTITVLAVR